ncbi:outer membrane beta-barrel protein [Massilia sp. METH4]|uniref:outer membrane beta-barrel protein n=1 Tax=Massilia sp. METH4 TaxID=3123041 RepID=UPI0030CB1D8B
MNPQRFAFAAAILCTAFAHAQVVEQPSQEAQASKLYSTPKRSTMQESFDKAFQPYPRTFGGNEAAHPNDKLFKGLFKRDPKLVGGWQLTPNLAIEGGYMRLLNRGFHRIDAFESEEAAKALDFNNFSSYFAVNYTLPLTDKWLAYGKVGVAHSVMTPNRNAVALQTEFGEEKPAPKKEVDTGAFLGVGAQYKVTDKATLDVQHNTVGQSGNWGSLVNSGGLKANLKVKF